MNNKGFTMVELIVSFTLTSIIVIILLQMLFSLKELHDYSDVKTKLLTKQAMITNKLNKEIYEKEIFKVKECNDIRNYCLEFTFKDRSKTKLIVDSATSTITIGNSKIKLTPESHFGNVDADVDKFTRPGAYYDSILTIKVPIEHDYFEDQDFGLYIVYQFNNSECHIDYLVFG